MMKNVLAALLLALMGLPLWASDVPEFSVKDPADAAHTQADLLERGAVVVITIPNAKHGDFQSAWSKHLKKTLPEGGPRLVIVEDLSQSNVKEKALKSMKEKYKPGQPTLLLLDEDGSLRRSFNVRNDETVVLVFTKEGKLIHRVMSPGTADEIIDATKKVVQVVKESFPAKQ